MKTTSIEGKLNIKVIDSGQGVVAVVEELPIVIESQNEEQLKSDISDAIAACIIANPKAIKDMISVKIPA